MKATSHMPQGRGTWETGFSWWSGKSWQLSDYSIDIQIVFWLRNSFVALIITQTFQSVEKNIPYFISKSNWWLKIKTLILIQKQSCSPTAVVLRMSYFSVLLKWRGSNVPKNKNNREDTFWVTVLRLLSRLHKVLYLPGIFLFCFVSACPSSSNNQRPVPLCIPCQRVRVYCCTL